MPVRKLFNDAEGNELEALVNEDAKLFISVGKKDEPDGPYGGWIVLDRSDLDEFIDLLLSLKEEVFNESDLEEESPE
jgi:hypothetical protein